MQFLLILALICALKGAESFLSQARTSRATHNTLQMNMTPLVAGGKRFEAKPGSSMLAATKKLGLKVPTSCKKGDCGVCTVTVGGKKIRSCIGKVPDAPKLKSLQEKGLQVTVDNQ